MVYPTGVVVAASDDDMGYDGYFWPPAKEEVEPVHCSEGVPAQTITGSEEKASSNNPDLSPRSSSSGIFTFYTPDSATSPNKQSPSPHLTSTPQRRKEENNGSKKVKIRTAFSQEQLQILHHRFQSQKYLSPQQIRELSSVLGLTYKQIKTWFQNQRMKFKRTQKETLWMRRGMCQPQNGYLDINASCHQGYAINDARNIHSLANVHENYANSQISVSNQNYNNDHSQIYSRSQSLCPIVNGEDGSFFGKTAGACYGQQAIGYISQQKMNFYHGFSASLEYATVKREDGYKFPSVSATAAGNSVLQHYQTPFQTQGSQSNYNS
ncbi:homeobox protein NANOG-like isoform X2 [Rhineura floridana]|uniref:homeobox protein NANOG-like isoform X2 n=1 Tax=Rhineura floridana TaxID=261503 RepID=UPI002AC84835|nr:homeobox protein NANOG-like isoform X2 [Rhineura floridana]